MSSNIQASISNNMSQIIPFPLVSNTTAPADWVGEFSELVAQISQERIAQYNYPDCVRANAQYGGVYLECKTSGKCFHYMSLMQNY